MSESVGLKELLRRKIDETKHPETQGFNIPPNGLKPNCFGWKENGVNPYGVTCAEGCSFDRDCPDRAHLSSDDLHVPGAKDDKAKPMAGVLLDFSRALQTVVDVGTYGAKKYTRGSWAVVPEGSQRYLDAMMRHLLAMDVDPDGLDKETGLPHLAHAAWNALAVLELQARRKETF